MGCPEYELLISRYLDDELNEEDRADVLRHLSRCAACRDAVGRLRRLDQALKLLPPEPTPRSYRRDLFQQAERPRLWPLPRRWWWTPLRIASGLALVAVLVVVVLLPMTLTAQSTPPTVPAFGIEAPIVRAPAQKVSADRGVPALPDSPRYQRVSLSIGESASVDARGGDGRAAAVRAFVSAASAPDEEWMLPIVAVKRLDAPTGSQEYAKPGPLIDLSSMVPSAKWVCIRLVTPEGTEVVRFVRAIDEPAMIAIERPTPEFPVLTVDPSR